MVASTERVLSEKSGRIPSPVRDLHDPQSATRFEEYYMRLLTTEFGDDLNSVRMSKDFSDKSLPMLVRALKQGVNIFDADEKRIAVGGVAE
ncbi:ribosome-assembly protein 3-domain-containing protein [Sphaerosporella brunnea]|uniref:Ribosome assembly protein 3 n=1 Tax=Sphaerosporella brunnea TaxID=1250544 RepID=A0A5J5F129_9PEZI|nr:ribosome-assembly protein 3-domain-containing protein [Sphaerosporella brunnea]